MSGSAALASECTRPSMPTPTVASAVQGESRLLTRRSPTRRRCRKWKGLVFALWDAFPVNAGHALIRR